MLETSTRLLRLLALLQTRTDWTGPQLADRLEVTTRTIRNDIDRLRRLGYPVHAEPGAAGGYRLGAGTSLPPLLLDDDEAVAVAVGLRMAASGGVAGIEEASLRALARVEQVLPSRLRHRVVALHDATLALPGHGPQVDPEVLSTVAAAIRARERLRFDYDTAGLHTVEPHRLVHTHGSWYLVAWDPEPDDWRIFRVDRIRPRSHHGTRFRRREDPEGDIATYVEKQLGQSMWHYRARVKVHAPAERVAARVPPAVVVEAIDARTSFVNVGSDDPRTLAFWLAMIDEDFDARDHPELAQELRDLAARYLRAAEH
ncbi:MAG TPA: WYL domain-containing protein [Solirubrobacter sp.]|nr:WYL domain-containing protein [Solirubrobacter sp.]